MLALLLLALTGALPDRGIYPELLPRVTLAAPRQLGRLAGSAGIDRTRLWLRLDRRHHIGTLYDNDDPLALYPLDAAGQLDAASAAALAGLRTIAGAPAADEDRDGDGIVDRLDVLIGAKKLVYNGARYIERYVSLPYPDGDVPRSEGVCSDTIIRALRNAGLDLQRAVHEDILRAPAAYPMVEHVDASINHRRVRTLLPWFERHWRRLPAGGDYRPGDVVFMDTMPSRPGPDHIGIVSDTLGRDGLPLVVNNWTDGAQDAEMDLLSWVPVTHHYRWSIPGGGAGKSGGKSQSR
jgi:uncharacterized protein YijF (DUF1287 family)